MVSDNNTDTFIDLLKPEYSDALKYCKALCSKRSSDEAEDVLQESLMKAFENFDTLSDQSKFRSWFFKIITREFYNSIRKDFWKRFLPSDIMNSDISFPHIFTSQDEDGDGMILQKALSAVSTKERSAILLFEIAGFSIEEIKEIQNERSVSAVKSRLSRARKKLREFIENEENNVPNNIKQKSLYLGDINNETIKLIPEADNK